MDKFIAEEQTIVLNHYWPYGMNFKDQSIEEDKNLLYLYSIKVSKWCRIKKKECKASTELLKYYCIKETEDHNMPKYLPIENLREEFSKYMSEARIKCKSFNVKGVYLVHTACLDSCKQDCYKMEILEQSDCLKFFGNVNKISVYLDMNTDSFLNIPDKYLKNIFQSLKNRYFAGEFEDIEPKIHKLSNTSEFELAEIPESFKLELFDFQLRTISWMKAIESCTSSDTNTTYHDNKPKFKLGDSPYYLENLNDKISITTLPKITDSKSSRVYGGILADESGSGKTITSLGLIHFSPFTEFNKIDRIRRFGNRNNFMQSKATLIVCPDLLYKQWNHEAMRCNPNFKIVSLLKFRDDLNYCWKDLVEADVVIVAIEYLHLLYFFPKKFVFKNSKIECEQFLDVKGRIDLRIIHFYRIIFDNVQDLICQELDLIEAVCSEFQADYVWGLDCNFEPEYDFGLQSPLKVLKVPERLQEICDSNKTAQREFIRKHVMRNSHNFQLQDVKSETLWTNITFQDLDLMKCTEDSKREIIYCTKFQPELTKRPYILEDVRQLIEDNKRNRIELLKKQSECVEDDLESSQKDLDFFIKTMDEIGESDKTQCRICFEFMDQSSITFLCCSHFFCDSCMHEYFKNNRRCCPLCNYKLGSQDIYNIRIKSPESKIKCLHNYILNLFESDENARVILCYQFEELKGFIKKSLKELRVKFAELSSYSYCIEDVELFRKSKKTRLLIANISEKFNGLYLIEATHVIFLHSFCTRGAYDALLELQALKLAKRFGSNHSPKLVRFAILGSVEEKLIKEHEKKQRISNQEY